MSQQCYKDFPKDKSLIETIRMEDKAIENMERIAGLVLSEMSISSNPPIPIVAILKRLGFRLYGENLSEDNLSGFIVIDEEIKPKFKTNRVIYVNTKDNIGHQRFTAAHELAHYLFDYDEERDEVYYSTYRTDEDASKEEETRANLFAANLLMPRDVFVKAYYRLSLTGTDSVRTLAELFKVSTKAVQLRIADLHN